MTQGNPQDRNLLWDLETRQIQEKSDSSMRKEASGFRNITHSSPACYYRCNDTTGHCDLSEENSLVIRVELDLIKMKQCLISFSQTKENMKLMWSALLPSCIWKESNEVAIDSTSGGKCPQMKQKLVECKPLVFNALIYDFAFDFLPQWDHSEQIYKRNKVCTFNMLLLKPYSKGWCRINLITKLSSS